MLPDREVRMFLAKVRLVARSDGRREAVLRFVVPLVVDGEIDPRLRELGSDVLLAMMVDRSFESARLGGEAGPYNMRCRALPRASAAGGTEQFLAAKVWDHLRLRRVESGIELQFETVVSIDRVNGLWCLESFGNDVFCELELAQPELATEVAGMGATP